MSTKKDDQSHAVADQNIEHLIGRAYTPEQAGNEYVGKLTTTLLEAGAQSADATFGRSNPTLAAATKWSSSAGYGALAAGIIVGVSIGLLVAVQLFSPDEPSDGLAARHDAPANAVVIQPLTAQPVAPVTLARNDSTSTTTMMMPRPLDTKTAAQPVQVSDTIETGPREKRLVVLPDESVLFVNENARVVVAGQRRVELASGEVFVEVSPRADEKFSVVTQGETITALGTKFNVRVGESGADVLVTHGQVRIDARDAEEANTFELIAGQQLRAGSGDKSPRIVSAARALTELEWTRDLQHAARGALVPRSEKAGGAIICIDPNGQEMKLSLRKYHVDVFIQDGFARTTIDQTYFNHLNRRTEGTFYFPLPADASLSRLAMYVGEKLMEGGMAERDHARNVYESIVYRMKDPALLEWVDGTTFKMRVFPLEPRQEKRIILSYTQKLTSRFGGQTYRFPAGHTMNRVGVWSFKARVKDGANSHWSCNSHALDAQQDGGDLVLATESKDAAFDRDVVLHLNADWMLAGEGDGASRFATAVHEKAKYLMFAHQPDFKTSEQQQPRRWVFLFESSAARDPVVARAQVEIIRTMLENIDRNDTFNIVTAATRARVLAEEALHATPENVNKAIAFLDHTHLVGAMDLQQALGVATGLLDSQGADDRQKTLVHVGSGIATLGERAADRLVGQLPESIEYIGVGVGKQWSAALMKGASSKTGGYFTQINPDEDVYWRAYELLAAIRSPRLTDIEVTLPGSSGSSARFLLDHDILVAGESFTAITRAEPGGKLPTDRVIVTGRIAGQPVRYEVPITVADEKADYLPRIWAKLEIDRLLADGEANKQAIIALSKAMYVMSPYTSLLVLENEAMYEQYNIDRGRKDHWALYPAPDTIEVVHEPLDGNDVIPEGNKEGDDPRVVEKVLASLVDRRSPSILHWPGMVTYHDFNGLPVWHASSIRTQSEWKRRGRGTDHLFRFNSTTYAGSAWAPDDYFLRDHSDITGFGLERRKREYWPFEVTAGDIVVEGFRDGHILLTPINLGTLDYDSTSVYGLDTTVLDGRYSWKYSGLDGKGLALPLHWNLTGQLRNGDFYDEHLGLIDGVVNRGEAMYGLRRFDDRERWRVEDEAWFGTRGFNDNFNYWSDVPASRTSRVLSGGTIRFNREQVPFLGDIPILGTSFDRPMRLSMLGRWPANEYRAPRYRDDQRIFSDLLDHAPGMNTQWADVQAAIDEATTDKDAQRGKVDDDAKALIERARAIGWRKITIEAEDGQQAVTAVFDGRGRHRFERALPSGLREVVVCDGTTLWHLYPQICVGGERMFSEHHAGEIQQIAPWLLPSTETLSKRYDVIMLDEQTVGIHLEGATEAKDEDGKPLAYGQWRLTFSGSGQLAERRHVWIDPNAKRPKERERVATRTTFSDAGVVEQFNEKGESLGVVKLAVTPAAEPALTPTVSKAVDRHMVILPMPLWTRSAAAYHALPDSGRFENWKDDVAPAMFARELGGSQANTITGVVARLKAGDARLGYFTLLLAMHGQWDTENNRYQAGVALDTKKLAGDMPLARYIELMRLINGNRWDESLTDVGLPGDPFLANLAQLRLETMRWRMGGVERNDTNRRAAIETAESFIDRCDVPAMQFAMLNVLAEQFGAGNDALDHRLAECFGKLADHPGIDYLARYERARWLTHADRRAEARDGFESLYREAIQQDVLPPIDRTFRNAFVNADEDRKRLAKIFDDAANHLEERFGPTAVIHLAIQMRRVDEHDQAARLLGESLAKMNEDNRFALTMAAVTYFNESGQYARAEQLLDGLLADSKYAEWPELWRLTMQMAANQNKLAKVVRCEEAAINVLYQRLPDKVNVQAVRHHHTALFSKYHNLAMAMASLEQPAGSPMIERLVAAADRWRSLDVDPQQACQQAARALWLLGEKELAWDYLTTPLATKSNEAGPWLALGDTLRSDGQIDLADRAYATAFDVERTNADALWRRAELMQQVGRFDEARQICEQIVETKFQDRFGHVKRKAQRMLDAK